MSREDSRKEEELRPTSRERLADWLTRIQSFVYLALVLCLLLLGFIWQRMFFVIPPGHLGVVYRTLKGGTDTERTFGEGLHIIPPWDRLYIYDMQLQQKSLEIKVLSDEGLSLGVQVVVRFRPQTDLLGHLHRDIGPNYFERLIKPEIESHVRRIFGTRPAHELYATVREVLQEFGQISLLGRLLKTDQGLVSRQYVQVQDLKLVIIELPKIVENAIVEKYQQEQLMLAYKYKLEREQKEADRKRTEAAGIRDFAQIAGKSVDITRWRGLEVASDFAKSTNAKFVVLGGGQGPLPMILNLGDSSAPPSPPPADSKPEAAPLVQKKPPATNARPLKAESTGTAEPTQSKPALVRESEPPSSIRIGSSDAPVSPAPSASKDPAQKAVAPQLRPVASPQISMSSASTRPLGGAASER